jgi:hypothetical protein
MACSGPSATQRSLEDEFITRQSLDAAQQQSAPIIRLRRDGAQEDPTWNSLPYNCSPQSRSGS